MPFRISSSSSRLLCGTVPLLLALASGIQAGDATDPAPLTPEQVAAWEKFKQQAGDPSSDALARTRLQADALVTEAQALYREARYVEAREVVQKAVDIYPSHPHALALREEILGILGVRKNTLQNAATHYGQQRDVRTQEIAVRLAAQLEAGKRKSAAGDHGGAEMEYDKVAIGMQAFPHPYDFGTLPAEVAKLKAEAQAAARTQDLDRKAKDRAEAEAIAKERAITAEKALLAKVEELIRRAQIAYDRADYRRAEIDAWNAYELDRRSETARNLYISARRAGHEQFDDEYRVARTEGLSRLHQEIHKDLIPQNDSLLFPIDWERRDRRKPLEIGLKREEAWVAALKDRLEQKVTLDFEEKPFEEVVEFLRQVTGTSIIVAPQVANVPAITLKVKAMRFADALKWIMELTSLHYAMQDEAIFIGGTAIAGSTITRIYDVSDLVSAPKDLPGPVLGYGVAAGGANAPDLFAAPAAAAGGGAGALDVNALVEQIQRNAGGGKWDTAAGFGIKSLGTTQIIITHNEATHEEIDRLLAHRRVLGSLMVTVHVSILDIQKGFYEEIGVDYTNNPPGIIGSNTENGYTRLNDNVEFAGRLRNNLPANGTSVNYSQNYFGSAPRGIVVEASQSPFNFLNTDQLNMIFAASEDQTDRITVQKTSITCHNNQLAHALFIRQFAYISEYTVVDGSLDPTISTLNTGEKIEVRPIVTSDRKYVKLEVSPTSNLLTGIFRETIRSVRALGDTLIPADYPIELPNIETRSLQATVMIPDKGSLLLGGYTSALRQQVHSGIPFLSHIPFLGRLFSRDGLYDENRRVFFLLQVEILDVSEREKNR